MKKLLVIALAVFAFSCSSEKSGSSTTVLTIFDKTEGQKYQDAVTVEWYLKKMKIDPKGLAKKTKGSGTILFSEFSAFSLNKMKKFELSLEGANNPLMKQKRIKEFVENFDEGLPEILGATGEAENSQIFGPLVQSIGQMNGSGKKVVLLFSDMIENGGETSFYRGDPAKSDREKLEKQYGLKMPDLKGYEVYIVYNPAVNPGTSELARKSAQFFKSWMEERGAKVKTVANLL